MATLRNPYDPYANMLGQFGAGGFAPSGDTGVVTPPGLRPITNPTMARGTWLSRTGSKFGIGNIATNAGVRNQFLQQLQRDPRFAGSSIFGRNFDKLRLKDGTVIDYIKDVGGPKQAFAWHIAGGPGAGMQRIDNVSGRGGQGMPRFAGQNVPLPKGTLPNGGFPLQNKLRQQTYGAMGKVLGRASNGQPLNPNIGAAGTELRDLIARGGAFNEQVVNRRMESVREGLDRQRKSQMDTLRATLADRGLASLPGIAQGPEATGLYRTEQDIASQFATAARDINTTEMEAANERYAGAINQLTGLGVSEANTLINLFQQAGDLTGDDEQRLLEWMISERGMSVQQAQLALEQSRIASQHALGVGRLGLDRDVAMRNAQGSDIDRIINLLQIMGGAANTSAGGYY